MTVTEFYEQSIKSMPPAERLRLAKLILDEIAPEMLVDYSDQWSDEDLKDISQTIWRRFDEEEVTVL